MLLTVDIDKMEISHENNLILKDNRYIKNIRILKRKPRDNSKDANQEEEEASMKAEGAKEEGETRRFLCRG